MPARSRRASASPASWSIPGLTEPLAGLADDDWEYCLSGLEAAKLLTVNRDATGALVSLDAHPHLREYFAVQVCSPGFSRSGPHEPPKGRTTSEAWRAAHPRRRPALGGRRAEAETRFREAEQMQQERQPDLPLLYSLRGVCYCDLLLAAPERAAWQICLGIAGVAPAVFGVFAENPSGDRARRDAPSPREEPVGGTPTGATGRVALPLIASCRAVSQRAAQTLKWEEEENWLLDIALDHLTLGRAAFYAAILERSAAVSAGPAAATPDASHAADSSDAFFPAEAAAGGASPTPALQALQTARRELDAAVSGLRRAGTTHHILRALLTRAWQRFLTGARTGPESAQEVWDEAWEIAERGTMKLFLADIHLYRARLFGLPIANCQLPIEAEKYPWESSAADLAAAEKLINACGYHRRDEEIAAAKRAILGS